MEQLVPRRVRILVAIAVVCLGFAGASAEARPAGGKKAAAAKKASAVSKKAAAVSVKSAARPKTSAARPKPAAARPKSAASKAGKTAKTPRKPAPPPEPDPLAGTWPRDGRDAWLGNGRLESELVVAALRLVGLQDSFDGDSFVRHVLYVNDLARKDALPADRWAESLAKRLEDQGHLSAKRTPRRGDLAFFGVSRTAPGSTRAQTVLAGVVSSVGRDGFRFVAPLDGRVQEGYASRSAKKAGKRDSVLTTCRKGKSRQQKAATYPCRAGELLIGTADPRGVAKIVD